MSTITKNRRSDDKRPATIRNAWQSMQNVAWTISNRAHAVAAFLWLGFLAMLVLVCLVLSGYVFYYLFRG